MFCQILFVSGVESCPDRFDPDVGRPTPAFCRGPSSYCTGIVGRPTLLVESFLTRGRRIPGGPGPILCTARYGLDRELF